MARHDDDYRFRNYSLRHEDGRESHRDSMSGGRVGWQSHEDEDHDRARSYGGGSSGSGRYGGEREERGSSRWFGGGSRENEGRYDGHEGERGERGGRYGSESDYGGGFYGRGNYEQDDMSSGGLAGGARGYGYGSAIGNGDMHNGRGGTLGGMNDDMGGSHSTGMGRQGRGGGWFGGRVGELRSERSAYGGAGRYGSEHAGMAGGYGIGAAGQEHHGGKGPKGYTRSDDRIREDVCDCLTDDPMLDAGEIEVQVKSGEVTLSGTVSDRLAKRHAEDMIERVSGVKNVQNGIRVKERDTDKRGGTQTGKHSSL